MRGDEKSLLIYDLRHSRASLLIERGFNILMVSQRLGHEKVEATWRIYAHLFHQFQSRIKEQPALIDISSEQIFRWNPETKEKVLVSQEEFESESELDENIEGDLAVAEIYQAGYLEICGMVYCLASRGLPMKFL